MSETFDVLTYGCYIVTTALEGRLYGMTVSWATQLSSDRILLVLNDKSATAAAIRRSRQFGLSVLTRKQKDLALLFGNDHSDKVDKFKGVDYEIGKTGVPILIGSLKIIECTLEEPEFLQDKSLAIGRIKHFRYNNRFAKPLLLNHIDE